MSPKQRYKKENQVNKLDSDTEKQEHIVSDVVDTKNVNHVIVRLFTGVKPNSNESSPSPTSDVVYGRTHTFWT